LQKIIKAIYEKGVLKLIKPPIFPELKEHEEIKLMIIPKEDEDIVLKSRGIFKTDAEVLKEVAESEELLYED
jgi:predicted DNA-binding antitoxin AbrB/MazE fold protein